MQGHKIRGNADLIDVDGEELMDEANKPRSICLVQANQEQSDLIVATLRQSRIPCMITTLPNGREALEVLQNQGATPAALQPDLILLDWQVPDIDPQSLLVTIKSDPKLRRIPIIILALSQENSDILNTYALRGNCYVIKPDQPDQLTQLIKRIEDFWLGIVTLPVK